MNNSRRQGLNALAALAAATFTLSIAPAANAAPEFDSLYANGAVTEQADGTTLLSVHWEADVNIADANGPITFQRNALVARDADGNDHVGADAGQCTYETKASSAVATVTCDGDVVVPTADARYNVTALLYGNDRDGGLVGPHTLQYNWTGKAAPVDEVDPVDPDGPLDEGTCPAGQTPAPGTISGCVDAVGTVPVVCAYSGKIERWVPGTGVASFKGGRKPNGSLWRTKPLEVKAGHVVTVDKKFNVKPGTKGEACGEKMNPALAKVSTNAFGELTHLWYGTPVNAGGEARWDGPTNGYRLGNYGYATQTRIVTCKTVSGTDIITECGKPQVAINESAKVTLSCDGPQYTGKRGVGGWSKVDPAKLTMAGCSHKPPTTVPHNPPRTPPHINAGGTFAPVAVTQHSNDDRTLLGAAGLGMGAAGLVGLAWLVVTRRRPVGRHIA